MPGPLYFVLVVFPPLCIPFRYVIFWGLNCPRFWFFQVQSEIKLSFRISLYFAQYTGSGRRHHLRGAGQDTFYKPLPPNAVLPLGLSQSFGSLSGSPPLIATAIIPHQETVCQAFFKKILRLKNSGPGAGHTGSTGSRGGAGRLDHQGDQRHGTAGQHCKTA